MAHSIVWCYPTKIEFLLADTEKSMHLVLERPNPATNSLKSKSKELHPKLTKLSAEFLSVDFWLMEKSTSQALLTVKYFNTFLLKKVFEGQNTTVPKWNGSFGIPYAAGGMSVYPINTNPNAWVIEEARTQGGYNNTTVDLGVRAYLVEEDNFVINRTSSLIYSGIFNSRTGVNNTNQFPVGEDISKSLNPANGSIQKIYAEDTNLIIFQENKVSRALIDKDAIYSAEGGGAVTSSSSVIGEVQAYAGNYGISRDPQSFAVYGYRKYFTDRDRNAVVRLSQDGITEIS